MRNSRRRIQDGALESPLFLLGVLLSSIFTWELAIMIILSLMPQLDYRASALLDASLLTATQFPLLYFFLFRPLVARIAEIRNTDKELEKFHRAVEQTADSVMIARRDGTIEYVNSTFETITGFRCAEVVGQTPRLLKSGWYSEKFYKNLWGTILSGRAFHSELVNKRKNGEFFCWEQTITPIKDGTGAITHFISTARDVTDRRRLEELKNEVTQIAAHELRSPLMSIQEGIALVIQETAGALTPQQKELLTISSKGISRLKRVADHLLDLSRIETGEMKIQSKPFNMVRLIEEIVTCFQSLAAQRGIELKTSLPSQPIEVCADQDRIGEVLTNLISNALKFTPRGQVEVFCSEKGDEIECCVADTGRGISEQDLPKVFGKFQRFDVDPHCKEKGSGLGLAISKGIIDLHQGKIWAESRVNEGTKFTFTLPKSNGRQI